MEVPTPPAALAAFAKFVRHRLAEVQETLSPWWGRVDLRRSPDGVQATAKQVATVIVGAAAPFAPTSYARTRLLRQMHAAGLLSAVEAEQAERVLGVAE